MEDFQHHCHTNLQSNALNVEELGAEQLTAGARAAAAIYN